MESENSTSKSEFGELIGSLLGGTDLNYVGHRSYVRGKSVGYRNNREWKEMVKLTICKDLVGGKESQRLHR